MKNIIHLLVGDPKKFFSPFNVITAVILAVGMWIIGMRLIFGIGSVTNLSQQNPWGLWIGFDVLCGVALAAGGYTIAASVHLFGLKKYEPLVRPAILTGFIGYTFVVLGLILDLGRPWRMPLMMIFPRGVTSVLFEVGWCVSMYLTVQALEFVPTVWKWLGWEKAYQFWGKMVVWLTIFGVVLSTLHQSSLGSLFLLAPTKLHPLWYSSYLPLYFFVSSIAAGCSMVIFESALSHKIFHSRMSPNEHVDIDDLTIGLGKGAAVVLYVYFFLKIIGLVEMPDLGILFTKYGYIYMAEMLGFVALPCALYTIGVRTRNAKLVRFTGGWTVLGIMFNRFNISMIAMNWNQAERYVPSWMEIMVSVTLITAGVWVFRWVVNRMPVMTEDKPMGGVSTLREALAPRS